ncbi:MAG: amidohydrolase [Nanoarchaeota archaeon]|nr:amidohydrolase [Nanoarchaeota archaeon]
MDNKSILLKNCRFIVTQDRDRKILEKTDILISDGKIKKIAKAIPEKSDKVIDCSYKMVMPGMINTHTHLPMTLFRGYMDALPFNDWLPMIMKMERDLTPEQVYFATLVGALECIRFGTTAVADFYYFPYERAKAIKEAGILGFLDSSVMDKPLFFKDADEAIDFSEKFIKDFIDDEDIRPVATAHSIYLSSRETLVKIRDIAHKYNILKRIHVSESEKEFRESLSKNKNTPIDYLDSLRWLDEKTILVHANWITNIEIRRLAEYGCKVCHNPTSNMKLAYGKVMPLDRMLEKNVTVSLATDGPTSNNNLDIFEELKVASLLNKFIEIKDISDQQIFDMSNINGAKTLGIEDKTGSIEQGKQADIVTIELTKPHHYPINKHNSLISHIIYCLNGNDVCDTIARGRILMENQEIKHLDEKMIIRKFQNLTGGEKIW